MQSATAFDTIATERLLLRPFEPSDARRVAFLAGEYDVAKMCGRVPHPYSYQAAQAWVADTARQREAGVEFPFAITAPIDGLIGACGVMRMGDPADRAWEIGYWLGMPYWGEGYAREASAGLMEWAMAVLDARVFTAGHFADNPASGGVLRKLGFRHAGSASLYGLARQTVSPCERYVWPADAQVDKLAPALAHSLAHAHR